MTREELSDELSRTVDELGCANGMDVEMNATSVRHCGLMARYWSIKLQIGEHDHRSKKKGAMRMVDLASKHCCEWEKRKCAAWEKRRLDELPRIAAQIEEFRKAGSMLGELD